MAEEQDPLQGNTGGTKERAEELRQINLEGARAKSTLEGINGVFKDLGKNSSVFTQEVQKGLKGAISTSSEISAQIRNFSKNYKENIKLGKDLAGATVNMLKDTKSRKAFEDQVLKAQNEQAAVQAELINLEQQEEELKVSISLADMAAEEAILAQKQAQEQLNNVQAAYGGMLQSNSKENQALAAAKQKAYLLGNDIADQEGLVNTSLEKRALLSKQQADLETQISVAKAKGDADTAAALQEAVAKKAEEINLQNELVDAGRSAIHGLVELQKEQQEIEEYNLKQVENAQKLVGEAEKVLKTKKEEAEAAQAAAAITGDQYTATVVLREEQEKAAKSIKKGLDNAEGLSEEIDKINKATPAFIEAFEKFADLVTPIPIIGGVIKSITSDISKSAEMFKKAKAEGKSTFAAWTKAGMGFLNLGLFAAAAKFVSLVVDGAKNSSKAIVTLNKSVAGSTVNMTAQMGRVSAAAAKFKVPLQEAAATVGGLNESLGTALDFTSETTNQAVKLANKYGVSGDAVAHLLKLSASNKDTLTETVDAVTGGVTKFNALNGVSISTKAVFEDIGSASATTLRNLGKSPDAIVRAAAAARSLGMSMDDINSAAESTLDFQSSMAAEMETELMLGKDLNLDRLRAAAATGDTATQAAEMKRLVMENAGAIGNNVLAQEKFAATLGISREQYNQMLKTNDALAVLEGKSGAAQQANDKARKMSQGEIAKSVEATTGKLTDLTSRIEKFQENMALGAVGFGKEMLKAYEDGGLLGAVKKFGQLASAEIKKAFFSGAESFKEYFSSGSNLGKMLGVLTGGFIVFKAGQGIFKLIKSIGSLVGLGKGGGLFSGSKDTYTADGRLRVDGGGGVGDMGQQTDADISTSSLGNSMFRGNMFKYLGNNGGLSRTLNRGFIRMFGKTRFTKFMQTKVFNVLGKNSTMLGRALNNLSSKVIPNSARSLTKTFGTNNMSKILKQARGGNVKALSKVKKFVKPQFLKSALSKGMDPKVANTLLKSTTNLSKGARVMSSLGKVFTKGNIAAIAGGLIVDKIASSSKEKADKSLNDAANIQTNNVIGFNANVSDLSDKIGLLNESAKSRGIEKAAGVGSAALTGAGIGSMVGSIIPGIGTAIGGAVGGVIGAGVGLYQQYFSKEAKENAQLEKEARAEMLGITIEEEKLLRKKGVEEAVNLRLEEAAQAKEAASQMLQMDLASFAQMTAEEQNRHLTKLNLSDQMMEELNTNLGTATADLSKVINEEAQKIEDNSFVGKTKKFFSNLFGGGDKETATQSSGITEGALRDMYVEQRKAALLNRAQEAEDAQKLRNSVGASERTIAAAVSASEVRAQNIANTQKQQQNKDQNNQMRELQNQTALLYQYVTNPKKSVIKMDSYKVGESLYSRY